MILWKKNTISIAQHNIIMLDSEEDNAYIYLSRGVYDQALLLSDRVEGELSYLRKLVAGDNPEHTEAITYFFNTAPAPLNVLAPYLGLVSGDVELHNDMEELCGVLHMLSMTIDFNEFTKVPPEVRSGVEFTKKSIWRYKQSWQDIEMKLKVSDIDLNSVSVEAVAEILSKFLPVFSGQPVMQNVGMPLQQSNPVVSITKQETMSAAANDMDTSDDEEITDVWAMLGAALDEGFKEEEEKEKEEKEKETEAATDVEVSVAEKTEEEVKEVNEIDALIARLSGGAK